VAWLKKQLTEKDFASGIYTRENLFLKLNYVIRCSQQKRIYHRPIHFFAKDAAKLKDDDDMNACVQFRKCFSCYKFNNNGFMCRYPDNYKEALMYPFIIISSYYHKTLHHIFSKDGDH
jgi:hypothetical protein